jgi:hypothetical protein
MASALQDYAVMVICAADVDQIWHIATNNGANEGAQPSLPAAAQVDAQKIGYIHDGNFQVHAQLRCNDIFISETDNVYYGLVLKAIQPVGPIAPGDLLVAIRGTMDDLEWLNDTAALEMTDGAAGAKGQVGLGFWRIYQSMGVGSLAGAMQAGDPASAIIGIADQEACPNIFVVGHSLGAALATYLAYDLTRALGAQASRLRPYFFASPKTGTTDWVNWYQRSVGCYDLTNYSLDFVPMVPPDGDTLNAGSGGHNVHIIAALSPGALDVGTFARWDASKNHSPIGYARMLDQANAVAQRLYQEGA